MLGLIVIAVGLIYLLISILIVTLAWRTAKRRGVAGWKWGLPAALVMYLLVFWDHIPTLVAHKYYCNKYAGFTVYKTLDQWKAENPGVAETLVSKEISDSEQTAEGKTYYLNDRFAWVIREKRLPLSMVLNHEEIVDLANKDVLATYDLVWTGVGNMMLGATSLRDYKFWLSSRCDNPDGTFSGTTSPRRKFGNFRRTVKNLGGRD